MIDIHAHIVYQVDDGSRDIEETKCMLKKAEKAGFTDIICTPHYKINRYEEEASDINKKINDIQKETNINLYTGNEIYANQDMINYLLEGKAQPLANSNYVLFELPMTQKIKNLDGIVYSLLEEGYIPIIAHPERYTYVQKDPNFLYKYILQGVLFQSNYGSIIGQYGQNSKKTLIKLLKADMIHFLGADAHRKVSVYDEMPSILKELSKYISKEKIKELTRNKSKLYIK